MKSLALTLSLAALTSLGACAAKTSSPIPVALYPGETEPAQVDGTLVIMLPGAGDRVGTYEKHGFVTSMREAGTQVDVMEIDAHYGYYKSRTLLERLREDVIEPSRARYESVWVVGISMGGIGALLTAREFPDDIDGVVLMAPYLGRRKTLRAIDEAGGLAQWRPPAEIDPDQDWDVDIWRMLQEITGDGSGPQIHLLYGTEDFGVRAHDLLAAALPPQRVETTKGGHSWKTWTTLWNGLMAEPGLFEG